MPYACRDAARATPRKRAQAGQAPAPDSASRPPAGLPAPTRPLAVSPCASSEGSVAQDASSAVSTPSATISSKSKTRCGKVSGLLWPRASRRASSGSRLDRCQRPSAAPSCTPMTPQNESWHPRSQGRIPVLKPNGQRRNAQRGQKVRRLYKRIAEQCDKVNNPGAHDRNGKSRQCHVKQQHRRLRSQKRSAIPPALRPGSQKKQTAEHRKMQPEIESKCDTPANGTGFPHFGQVGCSRQAALRLRCRPSPAADTAAACGIEPGAACKARKQGHRWAYRAHTLPGIRHASSSRAHIGPYGMRFFGCSSSAKVALNRSPGATPGKFMQ